jgi:hypothetical protein
MAIKAITKVTDVGKNPSGITMYCTLNVDDQRQDFDKTFPLGTSWATMQPQLIQASKDLATAQFGVNFTGADTVLLLYYNFVTG